ncbi:hypothetical protein M2137_002768 [Parabacteroides sp. PFB2-10]|uniref:hypothetical protein n=1 Tax=Parabacteroides sp. PFB2-10 TaxID=1742405 RepID=UPI00247512E7|nr:hypothetical protein [Parabacteroides sp. PFB2-10]MDH6313975.1 hypothetical protein [Parabacteroides sp. PFB2-10]MDL2244680.1 hypothetical protein [Parabacteroides sp. OttesenSCG-928-J18]
MERILDIENVLLNEVDNPNNVYLYLEGDVWCAYERSAYYLAAMRSVILGKEVIGGGYDVVLLKAEFRVDDMSLPLHPGVSLKLVADDKLQFSMNRSVAGFPEWKRQQLEKLSA